MWDFPDQFFIPFPSFIDAFRFKLGEDCESPQSFAALDGGKYFVRNLFAISSHVAMIILSKELNHVFTLSFKEKEKSSRFITSGDTIYPLCVTYL